MPLWRVVEAGFGAEAEEMESFGLDHSIIFREMERFSLHNGLLQILGTVVADSVHPLNALHFVFVGIQVWLNRWEVRA